MPPLQTKTKTCPTAYTRLGRFCVFCQYFGFGSSFCFAVYSAAGGTGFGSFSFLGRFFQILRTMNTTTTAISSTGHR